MGGSFLYKNPKNTNPSKQISENMSQSPMVYEK